MTADTIDFPPIVEPPAEPAQPAALPATQQPIDLAKIELTAVALAGYGNWRKDVAAVRANLSTLALDLSTQAKIKEARALRQRLIGDPLAAVRKVSAGIKSKLAATSKAVGAELEQIEAAYNEADKLILPQIEKREDELEQERLKKAKAESERKAKHESGIARIRAYAARCAEPGMTSARIHAGIQMVEAMPTPTAEVWEEFAVPAANAICETLAKMRELHAKALADEAAAAEAERVRKENEELRARLVAAEAAAAAAKPAEPPAPINAPGGQDAPPQTVTTAEAGTRPAGAPYTPQQGANRDASAGQSHVAEGSASPTGRGADGPTACGVAPVSLPVSERITLATFERGAALIDAGAATVVNPIYVDPADGSVHRFAPGPITMIEPPPATPDEKPTLKLGDLNDWLKRLSVSAAQLEALGFPAHAERNAKLYKPSDKARIKAALIEWLEGLA